MRSVPRPDLIPQREAQHLPIQVICARLADLIGHKLTAYVGGSRDVCVVERWAAGERITEEAAERLRLTFAVVRMLSEREDLMVIRSWLIGTNPELGDRAPLKLLREADLKIVGSEVLGAAKHFYALG